MKLPSSASAVIGGLIAGTLAMTYIILLRLGALVESKDSTAPMIFILLEFTILYFAVAGAPSRSDGTFERMILFGAAFTIAALTMRSAFVVMHPLPSL
jgi:hypothetical protein